jgi:aromatic ring-opening dioxygenase catalytic subunit (LigB family)
MSTDSTTLPTLFIPHGGGPCFFMDWPNPPHTWDAMAAWLRTLVSSMNPRPKAILVISGHWEEPVFTVGSSPKPPLIYDYYGFPPHTYQLKYDAPGSPELAHRVRELFEAAGIASGEDTERGYDHGVFIPLKVALPDADIPVVQLSLKQGLDPAQHMAAGGALRPLRDEGVLILGSGMSWHNMQGFKPDCTAASEVFDRWLEQAVTDQAHREDALRRWGEAPLARQAHPREEHLAPLFVAAGAAKGEPGRRIFGDIAYYVRLSGFAFGGAS